jgi:TetR/AcrR family transcriptional repressor of nem operon
VNPVASKKPSATVHGRPREFDEEAVLSAAADAFWEHGYYATSIDNLCEATGLLRGSLYGAYRDKKGIFLAALVRYSQRRIARLAESLQSKENSREVLRDALIYYIRTASDLDRARACFITNTALELTPQERDVAELIEDTFRRMATLWARAFARASSDGFFHSQADGETVGNYLLCVVQGLRVLGKIYSQQELIAIVDLTLRSLE